MVRTCGACRLPLRWDETLRTCFLAEGQAEGGPGYYQACPRCCAAAEGAEPPPARAYPAGGPIPRHPYRDDYLPICGCCREALFENERCRPARVQPEDIDDGDPTESGLYQMCPRCLAKYAPRIAARLIGLGLFPAGTRPEALPRDALM